MIEQAELSAALYQLFRAGTCRLAPVEGGQRAVQQTILRAFATTGRPPQAAELEQLAQGFHTSAARVLEQLATADLIGLGGSSRIAFAYPFSAVPTAHRVSISGGAQVWSMCAIDALGIPAMLGTDVVITSTEPVTDLPITVTAIGGCTVWEPADAVVFVGAEALCGPAAAVCCEQVNFFASSRAARAWHADHPQVIGAVLDQQHAERLGRDIFGTLLN